MKKVHVVSDERGRIVSLSLPGDVRGVSGIGRAGILPKPGQTILTIDVPAELEHHSLVEMHRMLRVEGIGGKARLVRVEQFTEPFLKNS